MASSDDFTGTLDEKSKQKAKDELNEDEKNRAGAVETFGEWVKQQNWLSTPTDSRFLVRFLRTKKYSQLEARKAIEKYWRVRSKIPEWFKDRDPRDPVIQDVISKGFILRLPRVDSQGRIYVLQRPGCIDAEYIKKNLKGSDAIFRAAMTILDWVVMDERAQVNGIVGILDLTGYGMQHKMVIHTTENIKRFTSVLPSNPVRVKGMHLYNLPPVFEAVLTIVKSFIKQKIKDRIKTYGRSLVSLYDSIDMSVLPSDYLPDDYTGPSSGTLEEVIGSRDSISFSVMNADGTGNLAYNKEETVKQHVVDYMKALTTSGYGVDEKLKPSEEEVPAASFRKLNVD